MSKPFVILCKRKIAKPAAGELDMSKGDNNDGLLRQVEVTIADYAMLEQGASVLVAVSGGLDSMALFYVLKTLGYDVEVAHFDHQTRQGQSAEDAEFVRRVCVEAGVAYHFETEPIAENARRLGVSFEAYARERRYDFLTRTARERGSAAVATGHQQDDQVETILLGVLGLASDIGPAGFAPMTRRDNIPIIRPLVGCGRDRIEDWAVSRGISWREDSTNTQRVYTRNRIRLDFMPLLEKRSRAHLVRFAEILRSDTAFLDAYAASLLDPALHPTVYNPEIMVLDAKSFRCFPEAVQHHAVKVLAHRLGVTLSFSHCLRVAAFIGNADTGAYIDLGDGAELYRGRDGVHLLERGRGHLRVPIQERLLKIPGTTKAGGCAIEIKLLEKNEMRPGHLRALVSPWCQYFDWNALTKPLKVRSRKPGDTLIPYGMKEKRKVQDIMVESAVPAYFRDTLPLVTAGDTIIWVAGCRRGAEASIGTATEKILEIKCLQKPENVNPLPCD